MTESVVLSTEGLIHEVEKNFSERVGTDDAGMLLNIRVKLINNLGGIDTVLLRNERAGSESRA
jgi:hypothetical protein